MAHYYEKTATGVEPRHFVPLAKGDGLRPTRITDARKAGWYPSVTTIQGLLDKPALTDWKIQEHLKQAYAEAWRAGAENPLSLEEWLPHIKRVTQEALDKAPKDGTDFHDSIEQFVLGTLPKSHEHYKLCDNALNATHIGMDYEPIQWEVEKSFVHSMGFAGKVDLHCLDLKAGAWCVDWKTKNTADKWKPGKMHYPEMAMQLAAYRVGLGLDNARCANVFICLEDGAVEFHEWDNAELDKQWANFADLLRIWLRNAGYVPGALTQVKESEDE